MKRTKRSVNENQLDDPMYRLGVLENAVINYGGGIVHLQERVLKAAKPLWLSDPETARLLEDVARYLRDITFAGELDLEHMQTDIAKRKADFK